MENIQLQQFLVQDYQRFVSHWQNTHSQGTLANFLIISISDGFKRAKVITYQFEEEELTQDEGKLILEMLLNKIQWAKKKFDNPLKWLRIEWPTKESEMTWKSFNEELNKYKRNYFRSGIAYKGNTKPWCLLTEMELNANACLYAGADTPVAKVNQKNLETYIKSRHSSKNLPNYDDDMTILLFQTSGVFFDASTGDVEQLCSLPRRHGRRQIAQLNADITADLIGKTTTYLANQVLEGGRFEYGHFPCFGRTINFYNTLRHASSIYAMIEGYEFCRNNNNSGRTDDQLKDIANNIDSALDYMFDKFIRFYSDDKAYVLEENGEIKLGANAVAILALTKYYQVFDKSNKRDQYLATAEKLGNGILAMQKDNGQFVHILDSETLDVIAESRVIYYDGEAAFGLMRLYGITKNKKWIDCVTKAFDYFISAGHNGAHDHWLSYCSNELVTYKPEKKYFQFAVNNVKGYTDFIKNRITTFPTLLELSMAFHKMLLKLDEYPEYQDVLNGFDVKDFYEALHARANYLVNGFFFPEMAMYFKAPNTILHGCFIRHHSFRVRIDDVEHYLSGWIAYQHMIKSLVFPKSLVKNTEDSGKQQINKYKQQAEQLEIKPKFKNYSSISTLVWGGDVNLGRRQHYMTAKYGVGNVLNIPILQKADFSLVNLECVVSTLGEQGRNKGEGGPYYYRARPQMLDILRYTGVNAVACANNHSGDYGTKALMQQYKILEAVGIKSVGTGENLQKAFSPIYQELPNGIRLAIFCVDATTKYFAAEKNKPGAAYINPTQYDRWSSTYKTLFDQTKGKSDLILVAIHWGSNGRSEPDTNEIEIGHRLIDAGADAILGASAHELQGVEVYKNKPIIHDAGNLLFDAILKKPKAGGVFQLDIDQLGIRRVRFYPALINFSQTNAVTGDEAVIISRDLAAKCLKMGSNPLLHQDGSLSIILKPRKNKIANFKLDRVRKKDNLKKAKDFQAINYSRWAAHKRKDLVLEEVPKDACIEPIHFGSLLLVGIRSHPYFFNRRRMLWVESFWVTTEEVDEDFRVQFRAKPTFNSPKMKPWGRGTDHDPCDWLIPTSQWSVGKVYRDLYGLRPPFFETWQNGELQLEVSVITLSRRYPFIDLPFNYLLHRPLVKYTDNLPSHLKYRQVFPDSVYPDKAGITNECKQLGTWNAEQLKDITGGEWIVKPPKGWYVDSLVAGKKHIAMSAGRVMFVANTNSNRKLHENSKYKTEFDRHEQIVEVQDDIVGAIVERYVPGLREDLPILLVEDPIKAWIEIGIAARSRFSKPIIAVTGSVGKTTVSGIIKKMFGDDDILSSLDNYNSRVGTLGTLASLSLKHKVAIIEVAISALIMGRGPVTNFIQPSVALITNIGPAHIQQFKSEKNIALQKAKIFKGMKSGSLAVICRDIEYYSAIEQLALDSSLKVISYGEHSESNIKLINYIANNSATNDEDMTQIDIDGKLYKLDLEVSGKHMVLNAMAALAIAKYYRLPIDEAIKRIEKFKAIKGRGNISKNIFNGKNITLYNEAYNANPLSMQASLKAFDELNISKSNKVLILGDMLELGDDSPKYHLSLSDIIKNIGSREILLVGEMSKHLAFELCKSNDNVHHFDSVLHLSKQLDSYIKSGDSILIKASNGIGLSKLFN